MPKFIGENSSDYELRLRIQAVASNSYLILDKPTLEAAVKLYNNFEEEVEFVIKNEFLEKLFECGDTRTKQITRKLQNACIINKSIKSYPKERVYRYLHCTLAKLPKLKPTEIDQLIHREVVDLKTRINRVNESSFIAFTQIKRHFYEADEKISRFLYLKTGEQL